MDLASLPTIILDSVFTYCDLETMLQLSRTCRFFNFYFANVAPLNELNLKKYSESIEDPHLENLLSKVGNRVKKLNISNNKRLTLKTFETITRTCTNLTNLEAVGCELLFKEIPDCNDAHSSEDSSRKNIDQYRLYNLKYLDLSKCITMNEDTIEMVTTCFPNLVNLRLNFCSNLSSANSLGKLKNLENLEIEKCDLNPTVIPSLAFGCEKLKRLIAPNCYKFDDESLNVISNNFPQLEYLNLSYCILITTPGVLALSSSKSLKYLYIRNCRQVNPRALDHLSNTIPLVQALAPMGNWRFWPQNAK